MSEKGTWEKKSCCQGKCLSDWYNAEELVQDVIKERMYEGFVRSFAYGRTLFLCGRSCRTYCGLGCGSVMFFLLPQWLLWDSVIRGKEDTGKNKSFLELLLKSDRICGGEQKCSMKKVYC